jgi:hypothetical protein
MPVEVLEEGRPVALLEFPALLWFGSVARGPQACPGGQAQRTRVEPGPAVRPLDLRPLSPPTSVTVRDRGHALRFRWPPGWHHGREGLTPGLAPPGGILAVATFPPRANRRQAWG